MRSALMVLLLILTLRGAAQAIPRIDAKALDGSSVTLPDARHPALLLLGFSRKASDGVTAWSKVLSHTSWNTHAATVYEVAFLGGAPKPIRGFIVRSMRKQVPPSAQSYFLTVDSDAQPWKTLAAATDEDQPYILLVDATGHVRWRAQGPYTEAQGAEASRQIAALGVR